MPSAATFGYIPQKEVESVIERIFEPYVLRDVKLVFQRALGCCTSYTKVSK
jgi:hypothetical protein